MYYTATTEKLKIVKDYSGLSFDVLQELYIDEFKLLFRDAYVYKWQQSKEGRDYLEQCWMLTQTKPDRKKLRENFGQKGGK